MFDIWALSASLPGSIRFVAKQELTRIPLLGQAMVAAGHVTIDRTNRARAMEAYAQAARTIREKDVSVVVFPEGTRSRTGELGPFKNAPFGLAIAAQVPLVPVYVHATFRILPKGAWRLRRMPIRLLVGEAIPTAGLTLDDREALRDRARAAIVALRARVDAAAGVP
jgi:1-acyl-sn-glycerol-3-phosphate acyltransferase